MSQARILIVTQPKSPVRRRLRARISALGLDKELGERLFSPDNWHQTWCGPFDSGQEAPARLAGRRQCRASGAAEGLRAQLQPHSR